MNTERKSEIPVSSSYIPFIASDDYWKSHKVAAVEEYVPQSVVAQTSCRTKYGYVPTPINPTTREQRERSELKKEVVRGSTSTIKRRERRKRQWSNKQQEVTPTKKKQYIHPTSSIAPSDPYWFPVFWRSEKPKNKSLEFRKTYATLADKQRVLIKTYQNGKITVWRAGEEITLRKENPFGFGGKH